MYKSNINLNLYKTFYEVTKYGSISETAKMTYSSQPAISKSIKRLEDELQTKLFYRNNNGIELTDKGKELLFYIEEAYNSLVIAERSMIESENMEKGRIAIGVPSQIGTFYIFENIAKFHELYPNIEITIISKSTSQLLSLLESHEIDFVIDSSPIITTSNNFVIKPLTEVNNCFVASKNMDITNIKSIDDLASFPLILPIPGTSNRSRVDKMFDNSNVKINNVINIHTSEMIVGAVKRNLGIGYVIYDLVKNDIDNGDMVLVDVKKELPKIEVNLVYVKKYLTTAPLKFIKMFVLNDIRDY